MNKPTFNNLDQRQPYLPISMLIALNESSQGEKVSVVNKVVETFLLDIAKCPTLSEVLDISIISTQQYVTVLRPQTTIDDGISVPLFSAKGSKRALGQGLEVSINMLRTKVVECDAEGTSCRRPWLIVITDGVGTDCWEDSAIKLQRLAEEKSMIPVIINLGDRAEALEQCAVIPVFHNAAFTVGQVLDWVKSSMQIIAKAQVGQMVRLPSPPSID
ncbi:hypothetical protein [Vibrio sp. SCSIO 43136]|uniref:hypothetical protein n=1 Tax=Vibrio sp. SCSIO 43136 TaxID=2819101 RepID=UPI0020759F23|nr:hypothetical protein [Vibrio sp. SCSIO 43136]USD65594.1 hypothetical protein J4N39_01710 [Vibrio sp. SCSIO 43136]